MAQGTGQARRRQAGKDKASGRKAAAASRGNGATRRPGSSSTRGSSKTSSNGRSGGGRGKTGESQTKRKTASSAPRSKVRRSGPAKKTKATGRAVEAVGKRAIEAVGTDTLKAIGKGVIGAVGQRVIPAARGSSAKLARSSLKGLGQAAQVARPAARPLGVSAVAVAVARLAVKPLAERRRRRSHPRFKFPIRRRQPRILRVRDEGVRRAKAKADHTRRRVGDALPPVAELPLGRQEVLWTAALAGLGSAGMMRRGRRPPIQQSIDIAVPLDVAYDEWMQLDFLPEGAHRVEKIDRGDSDSLTGRLAGSVWPRRWEAEILDERGGESFAWRSVKGSDCAGLVTFHRLGERLTRLELQLDVVPVRPSEAIELGLRLADARTRAELRRFKARLETISPDAYGTDDEQGSDEDEQDDHNQKES